MISNAAVIFIGTDKYLNFLPRWYQNCEEYFLPDVKKQYFVFTDGQLDDVPENISVYKQEHLPWPYITLYRFSTILNAKEELSKYEWIIFLDADMLVIDVVNQEEVFTNKKYIGVHHPCHYLKMPPHNEYPGAFETNALSTASISEGDDISTYWQGCLWGGKVPEVFEMMETLHNRILEDEKNNTIAVWHDESQMNKFFIENKEDVHTLHPKYAYPEDFSSYCNFEPKIIHLSKDNSKYHA